MKKLAFVLASICFAIVVNAQETWQATITVTVTNDAYQTASGTMWLTGNHLVCRIIADARYAPAIMEAPGANGPIIFGLDTRCAADTGCGYVGEFFLTSEQVVQLRMGQWSVALGGNRRQIVFDRACRFMATNEIEIATDILGDYSVRPSRGLLRYGRARCGLTGDNFSYEITMPAAFAPYGGFIRDQPAGPRRDSIVVDFASFECVPAMSSHPPPDAIDLELLPQCVIRGAFCAPTNLIPDLLAGGWLLILGPPEAQVYFGSITPVDSDQDGVPDYLDQCPATAANSLVHADGCSIADLCLCDGPWKSHGEYLRCLMKTTKAFLADGVLTPQQRRTLLRQALRSDCGKKKAHHPIHGR